MIVDRIHQKFVIACTREKICQPSTQESMQGMRVQCQRMAKAAAAAKKRRKKEETKKERREENSDYS